MSSSCDIPIPSSIITRESFPFSKSKKIFIFFAFAVILLSIISATALSNEYPISLSDSIREDALGSRETVLISISLFKYNLYHYNN